MKKNVALAVVVMDPTITAMGNDFFAQGYGLNSKGMVDQDMVREWINKGLETVPQDRAKVAAIEEIVIVPDEDISSDNYGDDMTQCYIKHMTANNWARPASLRVFFVPLGLATVYIAYGN